MQMHLTKDSTFESYFHSYLETADFFFFHSIYFKLQTTFQQSTIPINNNSDAYETFPWLLFFKPYYDQDALKH